MPTLLSVRGNGDTNGIAGSCGDGSSHGDGWAGEWLAAWPVGSSLPRTLYSHLVSSKSRGNSEQRLSLNSKTTF
uniref:Uncharacterized protein n=1 Tax=Vespula pensylvanica TaxID=30213 RepID=A0A834U7N2_VESPE|nr:hypothetical protein H0235_010379 [Vespula pensylvanica]